MTQVFAGPSGRRAPPLTDEMQRREPSYWEASAPVRGLSRCRDDLFPSEGGHLEWASRADRRIRVPFGERRERQPWRRGTAARAVTQLLKLSERAQRGVGVALRCNRGVRNGGGEGYSRGLPPRRKRQEGVQSAWAISILHAPYLNAREGHPLWF